MTGGPLGQSGVRTSTRRWLRRHRNGLVASAAVVLFLGFALLVWRGPTWLDRAGLGGLSPVQRETAVDAFRGRLIQLGAGALAVGVLVFTGLTFWLSREGHVTDRYTKAIEQLGSERLDVRLGAIYALERIMWDSPRDHPTIVEVLAAFVREHTPIEPSDERHEQDSAPAQTGSRLGPATDVLAAVTVLARRRAGREERGLLNLQATNLAHADLSHLKLAGVDLTGANLFSTNLVQADLVGTYLLHANLCNASLVGADLTSANLYRARMVDAGLGGADLTNANLNGADLTRAHLWDTKFIRTGLYEANFSHAFAASAVFTDLDLSDADLTGVDLSQASLTRVELPPGPAESRPADPAPADPDAS
jgi:uncharacterized protein YjbI with pentapeptide repeats